MISSGVRSKVIGFVLHEGGFGFNPVGVVRTIEKVSHVFGIPGGSFGPPQLGLNFISLNLWIPSQTCSLIKSLHHVKSVILIPSRH